MIDAQIAPRAWPRALITDFGFSNAARRTNVSYSKSCGFTPGYNMRSDGIAEFTPWDPRNDVYALGVTCCQVCSVSVAVERFSEYGTLFRFSL